MEHHGSEFPIRSIVCGPNTTSPLRRSLPISLGVGKGDHHTLVTRLVVVSPDAEFAS
jgi:hypothetical protein